MSNALTYFSTLYMTPTTQVDCVMTQQMNQNDILRCTNELKIFGDGKTYNYLVNALY